MEWIKVNEFYTEIPADQINKDVFVVEFGGSYQLEIRKIDGKLKVTNGVNGWGNNCYDEFKDADVKILIEKPES